MGHGPDPWEPRVGNCPAATRPRSKVKRTAVEIDPSCCGSGSTVRRPLALELRQQAPFDSSIRPKNGLEQVDRFGGVDVSVARVEEQAGESRDGFGNDVVAGIELHSTTQRRDQRLLVEVEDRGHAAQTLR